MGDKAPTIRKIQATIPSAIAGDAQDQTVGEAPFAATVSSVSYTPEANITGTATNFRTLRLVNKGSDGAGTTVVASLAFSSGAVTATAFDEKAITLSAVEGATTVAQGDVLVWDETIAGTGLAAPGGLVQVELSRA